MLAKNGRAEKDDDAEDVSPPSKLAQAAALVGRSSLSRSVRRSMKKLGSLRRASKGAGGKGGARKSAGSTAPEWPAWREVRTQLSEDFDHALESAPMRSEVALHAWLTDSRDEDDERWAALLERAGSPSDDADAAAECLGLLPRGEDVIDICGRGARVLLVCASGRVYVLRRPAKGDSSSSATAPRELALPELAGSRVAQASCGDTCAALLSATGRVFVVVTSEDDDGDGVAVEVALPEDEPATQVVCSAEHSWALGASGRVFTLGDGSAVRQELGALRGVAVSSLAAGAGHCVAVTATGRVYGWGANAAGQLGLAPSVARAVEEPRRVPVSFPVARAACGDAHTVLVGRRSAWVWLGDGATAGAAATFFEDAELELAQVVCGAAHTVALAASGEVFQLRAGAARPQQIGFMALSGGDASCFLAAACGALSFALRSSSGSGGEDAAKRRARAHDLSGRALRMAWPSGGDIFRAAQQVAPGKNGDTSALERMLQLALKDMYTVGGSVNAHIPRAAKGAGAKARAFADRILDAETPEAAEAAAEEACAEADRRMGSGVDVDGVHRALFAAVKAIMRVSFAKHRDHRAFKTVSALVRGAGTELVAMAAEAREPDAVSAVFKLLVSPLAVTARAEHDQLALATETMLPKASAQTLHRWIFWEVPGDMLGRYLVARTVDAIDELIARRQLGSPEMKTLCRLARRLYLVNDERWKEQSQRAGGAAGAGHGTDEHDDGSAHRGNHGLASAARQPVPRELFCTRNLLRASPDFVRGYFSSWRRSREQRNAPFSLMRFPFLLSADLKTELLKIEDEETMRRTVMAAGAGSNGGVPYFVLQVRRERLLDDTIQQLSNASSADLKRPLMVAFINNGRREEGQDAGGVKKEFFQLLSAQLFNPDFAMFAPAGAGAPGTRANVDDGAQLWFNVGPSSAVLAADASMFTLVGKLLGLAMYNGTILDMNFVPTFYRILLGKLHEQPGLTELAELNPALASGLSQMLDWKGDDFEDVFLETFEAPAHATMSGRAEPLCTGGADMAVTKANRREFVDLYARFLLVDAVKPMTEPLLRGFHTLIPANLASLSLFRPDELALALTGSDVMDFEALRASTRYVGGFSQSHRTVGWFWEVVEAMTDAQKHELIRFATGAPKPPVGGMAALQFVLQRAGPDSHQLPTASTCFNTLLLPEYSSKEKLRERLLLAIQNAHGFGLQ